jgi:hypothetical protein
MSIRSQIILGEAIDNTTPRSFTADARYYPAYVRVAGKWEPAMFTWEQIKVARERAAKNPEDMPKRAGWFARLHGWFLAKF